MDGEFAGGRWVLANLEGGCRGTRCAAWHSTAPSAPDLTVTPSPVTSPAAAPPDGSRRSYAPYGRHAARVSITDPNG